VAPLQLKPRLAPAEPRPLNLNRQVIEMYDPNLSPYTASKVDAGTRRQLIVCGLWMRAGFVGASATAVGVVQLFDRDWSVVTALLTAVAGIALAAFGWRRAHAALSSQPKAPRLRGATHAPAHR
jgi:protein-S-isoprenylcysteine O-methyltransferase Ste14